MKSRGVCSIRDLIRSDDFTAWFSHYSNLNRSNQHLSFRIEDLTSKIEILGFRAEATHRKADDILFLCGELENKSELSHAEFADIENTSFENLSDFESQRQLVNERVVSLDRAEDSLEKARLVTSGLAPSHADAHSVKAGEEDVRIAKAECERETEKRDTLWAGIETNWARSFFAATARPEYLYQAQKMRVKAEKYYCQAEAQRQ